VQRLPVGVIIAFYTTVALCIFTFSFLNCYVTLPFMGHCIGLHMVDFTVCADSHNVIGFVKVTNLC